MNLTDQDKDIINSFIEDTVQKDLANGISERESRFNLIVLDDASFTQALQLYLNKRKTSNLNDINNMAAILQKNTDALTQDNEKIDLLTVKTLPKS